MNIAIVGGAGFIGTSIYAAFARQGFRVQIIDSGRRLARVAGLLQGVDTVMTDGLATAGATQSLKGTDVLIHLAWTSHPADSMDGMVKDASENIVASVNLFSRAASLGVRKIIFASSGGTVYGNTDRVPTAEDEPLNPISAYGVSKAAVERYLRLIAFHQKLEGVSLRIANPFGPYQLKGVPIGVIANFLRSIQNHEPLRIYGDGTIIRDYIWIEDVADAFLAATQLSIPSGEYNIGTGEGYSINRIAQLLEEAIGKSLAREQAALRTFDVQKVILDNAKFSRVTGWEPRVGIADGIRKMVECQR
ncbi:NAD-dependent epimerase/dehydratase family protein [Nitratireductor luteus]|uniref:NAD-dependent epimerase/dehydratase family protein n=1 Tax=Nitratireductor luteus TaxID=2976980 RepID=UPI00223EE66E|nr:NAD-dependent epimerase/dehydratase family protein [Nitratireductor luteus]